MNKLGKYGGEDPNAPEYQIALVLEQFYVDITYIDLIVNLTLEGSLPLTLQEALDWSSEKIAIVGVSGLNEPEITVATEYGLI